MTQYTLTVSTDLQGAAGELLAAPVTLRFTTRDRTWGAPMSVQAGAGFDPPRLAMNASGGAMLVYTTGANHVSGRAFSPTAGWGGPIQLDLSTSAWNPDVGIDAQGNAVAVWLQAPGYVAAGYYDAATATWGAPARLTSTVSREDYPRVAMNASGSAVAVWEANTFTTFWQPLGSRFTAGNGWSAPVSTSPGSTMDNQPSQTLVIDAAGNATMTFRRTGGSFTDAWAHHATPSGWDVATDLGSSADGFDGVTLAIDKDGNALAVYVAKIGSATYDLWARYYSVTTGWGPARKVETNDSADVHGVDVAFDGNGVATVVWMQSDGAHQSIWYNRLAAGSWGTPALAESDDSGDATVPRLAMDAAGNGVVVFLLAEGARNKVAANRYLAASGWGAVSVLETDASFNCLQPVVGIDAKGNAIAAWTGAQTGLGFSVRAARFE
jgi:hypothetical protein